MLELRRCQAMLVGCFARPEALEALRVGPAAIRLRIAPDELLLFGRREAQPALVQAAATSLAELDPGGLALERADAYVLWTLAGDGAEEAFRRLSAISLPSERPAFLQGLVAHVPAKVVVLPDELHVLVPSTLGHHLRARVLSACADLAPREAAAAPPALPLPAEEISA